MLVLEERVATWSKKNIKIKVASAQNLLPDIKDLRPLTNSIKVSDR